MARLYLCLFGMSCALCACGPVTDVGTPGLVNTLAGNGNVQPMGRFLGTGTLTSSRCDVACAPTHDEQLVLSGTAGALSVHIGATRYPAVYDGNTIAWRASIVGGTCNGGGEQVGVVTLTQGGAQGTRVNTAITHCNKDTQSCSCTYDMSYTRQ